MRCIKIFIERIGRKYNRWMHQGLLTDLIESVESVHGKITTTANGAEFGFMQLSENVVVVWAPVINAQCLYWLFASNAKIEYTGYTSDSAWAAPTGIFKTNGHLIDVIERGGPWTGMILQCLLKADADKKSEHRKTLDAIRREKQEKIASRQKEIEILEEVKKAISINDSSKGISKAAAVEVSEASISRLTGEEDAEQAPSQVSAA